MDIIFIHGLESSGKGFKGRFLKQIFPEILTPDFKGNLQERLLKLEAILKDKENITIIGSSFGGLMGAIYTIENSQKVKKLILLAPALNLSEKFFKNKTINTPTIIIHGQNDSIIPLNKIKEISENTFKNLSFKIVDDDHMLHKTMPKINWKAI